MATSLPGQALTISARCPQCQRSGRVPEQAAGKFVRCPACKHRFQVSATTVPVEEVAVVEEVIEEIPTVTAVEPEPIPVVRAAAADVTEVEVVEDILIGEVV